MKKLFQMTGIVLTAAMVIGMTTGCGSSSSEEEAQVTSVATICGYGSVGTVDRFAGVVSSRKQVEIQKETDLIVDSLLVEEGQEVQEGQVLFTYDSEEAQLNLEHAQLELEQLKNTGTSKTAEIAQLEKEKKSASKDQQLEYTIEIQEAQADLQENDYNIQVKQKEIVKLQATLDNLEVKATVAGIVSSINETGSIDSSTGEEKPYITITETGNYRVKGYVNENNAYALSEGMSIIIRSRVDDSIWTGTLDTIDWENPVSNSSDYYYYSDSSDDTTSSSKYPFYVELDSTDGLLLGQHVYIEPDYGQEDSTDGTEVVLSSWYLNDIDSKPWVWAESSKGKLEKRKVTLGDYDADLDTYVITDGLTMEDYIAFPDDSFTEGMTCVENSDMEYYEGDYSDDGSYDDSMMYEDTEYYGEDYSEDGYTEDGYTEDGYTEDGSAEDDYTEDGVIEESDAGTDSTAVAQ